ncbi:MAG TPA: DUF5117 domain-containing protein, partial [Pyrinomonadaceae bacterium]|nr:DUF5117 domain-containing protein [Pyrinomonadaceae bacterium]
MSKFLNRLFAIGLIAFVLTSISIAQDPPPVPTETPAGGRPTLPGMPGGGASQDPQPYDKVITKDAKTRDGIFKVHKVKDKYYYEIPKSEIDKQFLMVTQIASTTVGVGYGGQALGRRVVRWERNENKINLRNVNFSIVADPTLPIAEAVRNSNHDTILMSFPVAAWGPDEAAVIDVTRLFTTDMFEISARQRLNATTMDSSRTYIERISPFPTNIEARATHTYTRIASPAGAPAASASPFAAGMNPG